MQSLIQGTSETEPAPEIMNIEIEAKYTVKDYIQIKRHIESELGINPYLPK